MLRLGLAIALGLLISAPSASADPFKHYAFGRLTPGMTPEDATRAAPELAWRHPNNASGVSAANAIAFLGRSWDLEVGDVYGFTADPSRPLLYNAYRFNMETNAPTNGPRACFAMLDPVVAALEPAYGAFGRHPAFAYADNTLYGAPYGRFRLRDVGAGSQVRDYGAGEGLQDWTTFAEFDEASGQHAMIKATYFFDDHSCDLRIDISGSPERAARAAQSRAKYGR